MLRRLKRLKTASCELPFRPSIKRHDGCRCTPDESPRKEVFYFSDDGDLTALRYGDWKLIFMQQKTEETLRIWMDPFVPLRIPMIINLRRDPYERGMKTSNTYLDWMIDRAFLLVPAQTYVGRFLQTFRDYPPRMEAPSFSIDQVMAQLKQTLGK